MWHEQDIKDVFVQIMALPQMSEHNLRPPRKSASLVSNAHSIARGPKLSVDQFEKAQFVLVLYVLSWWRKKKIMDQPACQRRRILSRGRQRVHWSGVSMLTNQTGSFR